LTLYKGLAAKKIIAGVAGYVKIIGCCGWTFRQVQWISYLLAVP